MLWLSFLPLLPATGIEPVREYKSRRILSPVRLPVPPRRHKHDNHVQWMEVDSNHRSNMQQIYSLSPLATRESIHEADDRTRTDNLLITNQLLCQLSHIGI